jgi:hypothetical protein
LSVFTLVILYPDADPVTSIESSLVLSRSLRLEWDSPAPCFRILYVETENKTQSWRSVNYGKGEEYCDGSGITVTDLLPKQSYTFRVFAGNRFSFEETGIEIVASTISARKESGNYFLRNL